MRKPHYSDDTVTLYCGDARRMDELSAESIDLIITSPPYWTIKNYRNAQQIGLGQSYEEYLQQLGIVGREMWRVLRSGRVLCWVIGTHVSDGQLRHIPAESIRIFGEVGFVLRKEFVWAKPKGTQGLWQRGTTQFLKSKPYPGQANINIQHEFILVFQKPGEFPVHEQHRLDEAFIKETAWSVWELPVSRTKGHPAPFPIELPSRLIRLFSYPGEVVLDLFAGTGTTLLAARELGRSGVGYEITGEYCQLACRSLSDAPRQLPFSDANTPR
jgi:DNA modification methylase